MIEIVEVAPRDGLQNEPEVVPSETKIALIERLASFGARRIEVASFVNPRRVPQMADAEAVIASLPPKPARGFRATGLCLNVRGVERALAISDDERGIDEAGCVIVATDSFGIANQGQTVAEGIIANRTMIQRAKAGGLRAQVTIAASFGCPFEGPVRPERVIDIARAMIDAGAQEIALADTIGVAVPQQVSDLVGRLLADSGSDFPVRLHLHDTRGLGPANAWAGYQAGIRIFDSSLGGLGGCPFAPKATGNVATEDLAYLFKNSGVSVPICIEAAIDANHWFAGVMGRPLPSRVGRAGDFIPQPKAGAGISQQEHS